MLLTLMMLPLPLAAIPGANAATRKNAARTLLANRASNVSTLRSGVVDQDVNLAHSLDQALEIGWIAEVGADEACLAARGGNRVDSLGASGGVAAMDDDLGAVAGQLQGYCTADPGRRARHEGLLTLEVTRLGHGHCCSPKVVVHKPLGAHNSAVSVMVPDHGNSQKATPSESSSGVARFSHSLRLPDEFPGRS